MALTLRSARLEDAATLVDFNAAMALETEQLRLDPPTLSAGVRAALMDPARARYFVAADSDADGRVIGMLMLTLEWSDWRDGEIWWIQSVYVHPKHRRCGVFKALYRHVERLAREQNAVGLRLYVVKHNDAARATYASLGMELSEYLVMENLKLRRP
jgi:GNAT superfamily N-acetyltransferase